MQGKCGWCNLPINRALSLFLCLILSNVEGPIISFLSKVWNLLAWSSLVTSEELSILVDKTHFVSFLLSPPQYLWLFKIGPRLISAVNLAHPYSMGPKCLEPKTLNLKRTAPKSHLQASVWKWRKLSICIFRIHIKTAGTELANCNIRIIKKNL